MNAVDVHFGQRYNAFDMRCLMYGNTKFGINMTYGYFGITTCHHMRIDADTNRNIGMFLTKLCLQALGSVRIIRLGSIGKQAYSNGITSFKRKENTKAIHSGIP